MRPHVRLPWARSRRAGTPPAQQASPSFAVLNGGDAAEILRRRIRLRRRVEAGLERVRVSWWSVGQSALGGAMAWAIAVRGLGHEEPFFAAVAAIVCLSISAVNRLRRAGEMALGVAIGVGLGDLLVRQIERGAWQMGLVVLIAMTVALLLDGGALIVTQAALQAVFVVALPPPSGGYVGRWLDALVGGATALVIAFFLPGDPRPAMRRDATLVTRALAEAVRLSTAAVRAVDVEAAQAALDGGRAVQPMLLAWDEAVRTAEEISRLSPLRRHAESEIAAHRRGVELLDRALRNLRVALRRVVAAVEDAEHGEPGLPPALLDRLDELAGALFTLPGALRDPEGEGGRRAVTALSTVAGRLDPEAMSARSMSATVVVAQLRSAVVDLLMVPGLSHEVARAYLP